MAFRIPRSWRSGYYAVTLRADMILGGWIGQDGSDVYCYASIAADSNPEDPDDTPKGVEIWLWGPDDVFLDYASAGEFLHGAQAEARGDGGPGWYTCQVDYSWLGDNPGFERRYFYYEKN